MDSSEHDGAALLNDPAQAMNVQDVDVQDVDVQDVDVAGAATASQADPEPVPAVVGDAAPRVAPETPILSAMLAGWEGPAASLIGQALAHAEAALEAASAPAPAQPAVPGPRETERPSPIRVRVTGSGRAPVVTASGELSENTADQLAAPVQLCLLARPRQVIVDLSGITAVTPGAVTTLLGLREAAQVNGSEIELHALSRSVREILDRTRTYEQLRPRRAERPEPAAPASTDPDLVAEEALDGEPAGMKPKRSGERPPTGHRRAPRLRRPPQVV